MKTTNVFGYSPWEEGIPPAVDNGTVEIWIQEDLTKQLRVSCVTGKPIKEFENNYCGVAKFKATGERTFVLFDDTGVFDEATTLDGISVKIDSWKLRAIGRV